jgi:hypothetical protein
MAQLQPTTTSTTSTAGFEWINKPVEPENIVRYFCDASIRIDGCDRNLYPAICFNLVNKANQYWVYPNKDARDADCEAIADEVGPPPSDYLAFWDITGDGLPDIGTGSGPIAIYLGGVSGTHEADQLYFDETGVPNPLPSPFDGILQMRTSGSPYVLADFDGADGTSLALGSSWSGPFAVDAAMNIIGTVGHTNLLQFSKLPFAVSNNLTYARALEYKLKIKARKSGLLSGNTGNILEMPVKTSVGQLFGNRDIDIVDHSASSQGTLIYSSNFTSENVINSGVTVVQLNSAPRWSKNNFRDEVNNRGIFARVFADTASPTGWSMVYAKATTDRLPIFRTKIFKFDADGFPHFSPEENMGNTSAFDASAGAARLTIVSNFTSGGMPMMMRSPGGFSRANIIANTGTAATPSYSLSLNLDTVFTGLKGPNSARVDSLGRIYSPCNSIGPLTYRLNRLAYSGPNNDATAFTTAGNWSNERIGVAALNTPALGGDGATAQFTSYGVAIDEDNMVNGNPTIYMTDDVNDVIFKVVHNGGTAGDETDWTFTITWGQSGVPGFTNGVGTAALFDEPTGIFYLGGFLYVNDFGNRLLRRVNVSTLLVDNYFGALGISGQDQQFDF